MLLDFVLFSCGCMELSGLLFEFSRNATMTRTSFRRTHLWIMLNTMYLECLCHLFPLHDSFHFMVDIRLFLCFCRVCMLPKGGETRIIAEKHVFGNVDDMTHTDIDFGDQFSPVPLGCIDLFVCKVEIFGWNETKEANFQQIFLSRSWILRILRWNLNFVGEFG